jgi:putative oxidoreductase
MTARALAFLVLRLSIGLLMVVWGLDKLVNPAHGLAVSEGFYFDLFTLPAVLPWFGAFQIGIGILTMLGLGRRYVYPILLLITGTTLVGVWRSIVDPWGWYLEGGNALFFPSLIIFAAVAVLAVSRGSDSLALDR